MLKYTSLSLGPLGSLDYVFTALFVAFILNHLYRFKVYFCNPFPSLCREMMDQKRCSTAGPDVLTSWHVTTDAFFFFRGVLCLEGGETQTWNERASHLLDSLTYHKLCSTSLFLLLSFLFHYSFFEPVFEGHNTAEGWGVEMTKDLRLPFVYL